MNRSKSIPTEDRRKYPRLQLNIAARVQQENGNYLPACLHDLSPDGLQLRCDNEIARQIYDIDKKPTDTTQALVTVEFVLPQTSNDRTSVVKCSICHFARLSRGGEHEIAFGMKFRQFSGDSLQQIKNFFLSEMEPA